MNNFIQDTKEKIKINKKKIIKRVSILLALLVVLGAVGVAFVFKIPFIAVFACSYLCEDYIKAILCIKHFRSMKWIKPVTKTGQKALEKYFEDKIYA